MHDSTLEEMLMPPEVSSSEDLHQWAPPISDQHGFVTSADGTALFFRHWPAENWNGFNFCLCTHRFRQLISRVLIDIGQFGSLSRASGV